MFPSGAVRTEDKPLETMTVRARPEDRGSRRITVKHQQTTISRVNQFGQSVAIQDQSITSCAAADHGMRDAQRVRIRAACLVYVKCRTSLTEAQFSVQNGRRRWNLVVGRLRDKHEQIDQRSIESHMANEPLSCCERQVGCMLSGSGHSTFADTGHLDR